MSFLRPNLPKPGVTVLLLVVGLFVWFFAEALFGGGTFVFRDAGHYYYPLFQFIKSEWAAGRVPLWNPYENLGVPLAGNPTASVFYPGTLIFLLPLDHAWAYKLYVMTHVLLAAGAAYRLARHWGGSVEASGMGAISYAFCGNVLFQYSNVIFLVGAAWLPLAVLAADRMLVEGTGDRGQGTGDRRQGTGDREQGTGDRVQGSGFRGRGAVSVALAGMRPAILLGTVLALMTLGGNAEMAYHAGLVAAMYALWLWWHERQGSGFGVRGSGFRVQGSGCRVQGAGWAFVRGGMWRPALLFLAAVTGLILSAVQVLPSVELSRLSGRAVSTTARTLYEVGNHLPGARSSGLRVEGSGLRVEGSGLRVEGSGLRVEGSEARTWPSLLAPGPSRRAPRSDVRWGDGLTCRRLEPGTHHEHVYHFSVGPWRLAEYLWPNFSGRQFPVHRRWLEVIPAEGRIWVPSLYMGLLPFVLALAALRLGKGEVRESWLSWLAILSVVASFGWYGLGWLVHEIRIAAGTDVSGPWRVGGPFGGLYWLMTVLLPGYIYFRYPAKLLVIAALALSMLAVRGWDRAFGGQSRRFGCALTWLGQISVAGAMVVLVVFPFRQQWLGRVEPDLLFGPLDVTGACLDLLFAFLQTALLCGVGLFLLRRTASGARWTQAAALVLVAVDLAVANGWMIVCAPADQWRERPKLAGVLRREQARRGEDQPYRVFRRPIWMPRCWQSTASADRLARAMEWDRDTLWPKYHLAEAIPLAEVQGTMKPNDYQVLLWVARKRGRDPFLWQTDQRPAGEFAKKGPVPFFLAKYLILRGGDRMAGAEPVVLEGTEAEGLEDVSLWHHPDHLPRAWIVHRVEVLPPLTSRDPYEVWRRTEEVFFPGGRPRNLRESAVVEIDSEAAGTEESGSITENSSAAVAAPRKESCWIVRYSPSCVQIEAQLTRPGLVVLSDQFYPGWRLEVKTPSRQSRTVPILRTNRVMRGAWLPAGRHRLTYRYRPATVAWGAWISGLGWIALLAGGLAFAGCKQRRQKRRS